MLEKLFPEVAGDTSKLRIKSSYLFRYEPGMGEKTDTHIDDALLGFTILLSDPSDFEGGGTWFESLGDHGDTVMMGKGHATLRPATLRHRGQPVTSGVRYIIGGFVVVEGLVEHTRQLMQRAQDLLKLQDPESLAEAKRLLAAACESNPLSADLELTLGDVERQSDDKETGVVRGAAHGVAPTHRPPPIGPY